MASTTRTKIYYFSETFGGLVARFAARPLRSVKRRTTTGNVFPGRLNYNFSFTRRLLYDPILYLCRGDPDPRGRGAGWVIRCRCIYNFLKYRIIYVTCL